MAFRPDQVERLARMGMTVVTQPLFIDDFGDPLLEGLAGTEGLGDYFRMRSLLVAGVPVVGSSDRPVAAGSPLRGIQEMVERTTADGAVFGADERLTPLEALASYTAGGARAAHCEDRWGTLGPRLLADLVVLGDDPTTSPSSASAPSGSWPPWWGAGPPTTRRACSTEAGDA